MLMMLPRPVMLMMSVRSYKVRICEVSVVVAVANAVVVFALMRRNQRPREAPVSEGEYRR
jgi:hypothetical protein